MNNESDTKAVSTDDLFGASATSANDVKPKRRRTVKAVKATPDAPAGLEADVHPAEPALKPKRRRASAAVVDAPSLAETVDIATPSPLGPQLDLPASATDESLTPDEAVLAKPARKRAKKVKPLEESAPLAGAPEAQTQGREPVASPVPEAAVASADSAQDSQPAATVSVPVSASTALASEAVDAAGSSTDDAEQADEASGNDEALSPAGLGVSLNPQETLAQATERFADVLGGSYDADADAPSVSEPEKRVLRPQSDAPKLQKVLAQAGISSRRDIEQMVQEGRISVNGEVAHVGQRVMFGDRIDIDGKPVKIRIAPPPARVLAYHKPVGEVVTFNDPEGRPTVFRSLPRLAHGKWQSVGRLDINTEGLLLFSTSGELANQLMHPRFGVEREYAVRVLGSLDSDKRSQLLQGVNIDGYDSSFRTIEDGGGEGVNHWYRVTIAEGRYREVRRLFEAVGLTVSRLIRIRYGCVVLPRGLRRGVWVELNEDEVRSIRRMAQSPDRQGGNASASHGAQPNGGGRGQRNAGGGKPFGKPGRHGGGDRDRSHDAAAQQRPDRDRGRPAPSSGGRPQAAQGQHQRRDDYDDFDRQPGDPAFIPNPLEQTFDRRFAKGSKRIVSGFGRPSEHPASGGGGSGKKGGPKQPDPMQTSIGYIGADAFFRKSSPGGGGNKRRGGGGGGGGGRGGYGR